MKHDRKKHAERAWQCLDQAIEKRDWSVAFASLKHLTLATGRVTLGQLAVGVDLLPCETCEEDE